MVLLYSQFFIIVLVFFFFKLKMKIFNSGPDKLKKYVKVLKYPSNHPSNEAIRKRCFFFSAQVNWCKIQEMDLAQYIEKIKSASMPLRKNLCSGINPKPEMEICIATFGCESSDKSETALHWILSLISKSLGLGKTSEEAGLGDSLFQRKINIRKFHLPKGFDPLPTQKVPFVLF